MTKNLEIVKTCLDDGQAENVLHIALDPEAALADYMIIASGTSARHVSALAHRIAEHLKKQANIHSRIEGLPAGNWVLVDAGDIIVHIFRPEVRAYYQIEDIWVKNDAR